MKKLKEPLPANGSGKPKAYSSRKKGGGSSRLAAESATLNGCFPGSFESGVTPRGCEAWKEHAWVP